MNGVRLSLVSSFPTVFCFYCSLILYIFCHHPYLCSVVCHCVVCVAEWLCVAAERLLLLAVIARLLLFTSTVAVIVCFSFALSSH